MASRDFSTWVPIAVDNESTGRELLDAGLFGVLRTRNMDTEIVELPRLVGADVGLGAALTEDTNDGSKATLYSGQFNGKHTIDEATSEDSAADEVEAVSVEWLNSFYKAYDQASLGVTVARSATPATKAPFNSVYYTITQADATVGYTANANLTQTAGDVTYDLLSTALGKLEVSEFWQPSSTVAAAHPALRESIRGIKGTDGHPIFRENVLVPTFQMGTRQVQNVAVDTIFDIPVAWTYGAQTGATYDATGGNRLAVFLNTRYAVRGDRIQPQARFIPASINPSALEHVVQHRARQGFVLTVPGAASVLEVTAGV